MSEEKKKLDPRVEWIADRVSSTLKVKGDKLARIYTEEVSKTALNDFFELATVKKLIVYENLKNELCASLVFPPSMKRKSLYFEKTKDVLGPDDIAKECRYQDFTYQPLELLEVLNREIYLPMAQNHRTVQAIPDTIAQDVVQQFHHLSAATSVTVGKAKGQTLLAIPQIPVSAQTVTTPDGQTQPL
ncbi:MAG: putative Dynein beta chain, ciliary, partial [Streblomastix strix]